MVKLSAFNSFSLSIQNCEFGSNTEGRRASRGLAILFAALVLSAIATPGFATAELDSGPVTENSDENPSVVPTNNSPSSHTYQAPLVEKTSPPNFYSTMESHASPIRNQPPASAGAAGGADGVDQLSPTFTFSVPLMVAGSTVPHVPSQIPDPPSNVMLPPPGLDQPLVPLAWRPLALALPTQKTDSSHQKVLIKLPAPKCLEATLQECSGLGLAIRDQALPAGQVLLSLDTNATSPTRRSSLLIVVVPVDTTTSELHVKILAKSPSTFSALVNQLVGTMTARAGQTNLL